MDKKSFIEARKVGNNYVAINDIVAVEISTKAIQEDLIMALNRIFGNKTPLDKMTDSNTVVNARIVSFEDSCIVLDFSKLYNSEVIDTPYDYIKEIRLWQE
jgi:hypothetical protein